MLLLLCFSCNKKTTTVTTMNQSPEERRGPRGSGGDGDRREAHQAEMMAQLNLSDAQKVKFDEIQDKYKDRMMTVRNSNNGDREGMRETMMKMRNEQTAEVKKILTSDQFAVYQKLQEQRRRQRGTRRSGRPGGN